MPKKKSGATPKRTHRNSKEFEVAADLAIRQSQLVSRLCAFDAWLPPNGVRPSSGMVACVFNEARDIAESASSLAHEIGVRSAPRREDVDELYGTYEEFKRQEASIITQLEELGDAFFAPLASGLLLIPAGAPGLILADTLPGGGTSVGTSATAASGFRKWFAKFLAALGLGEIGKDLIALLEADAGSALLLNNLAKAIAAGEWSVIKKLFKILLELILSKPFIKKLGEKIGESVIAKLIGKIAAKFLPFVGWALLIGQIVWAIAEQFL